MLPKQAQVGNLVVGKFIKFGIVLKSGYQDDLGKISSVLHSAPMAMARETMQQPIMIGHLPGSMW